MAAHAATNLSSPTSQTFGRSATSDFSSSSQCDHRDPSDQQLPADVNPGEKRKRDDPDLTGDQDPSPHPLWKTSLCSYFRSKSGVCSHGTACRYAHGDEELRPRPDNSWDPTSERAKKLLKSESGKENDDFGLEGERVMMTEAFADGGDDFILSKCLVHLPKRWSSEELRGFLSEQGISFKSAKKKKGMTVGFVSFENAEQVCHAMEEMESKSINNKNVKVADIIPRSFEKKMNGVTSFTQQTTSSALDSSGVEFPISMNASVNGASADENSVMGGSVSGTRTARTVVTPLAHLLYNEQLEHKKNSVAHFLKKLTRNVRKACSNGVPLPEWICKSKEIGGLPCKLEGILESPCVRGYRNKCEFSVGYSLQGRPTVGFNLGNFREGVTAVEEPVDCPNVSGIAQKYALIFQDFLQHSSLPIWNRLNNTGFWRQLTVREGREPGKATEFEISDANIAEVMLIVQVCTNGVDDELLNLEFERMAQSFATGASTNFPCLPLTALVVQDHKGISNAAPAIAPLWSVAIPRAGDFEFGSSKNVEEARIHDYISGLKFCISPTAFFQVNTFAAEKLYSLAGDWARLCPDTLLFDICCGTGTIGLTLAHRVGMVVGIEMNASAVSDAQRNAEINGIENCRFINAKAEDVMGSLLKQYVNFHQEDEIADLSQSEDKEIIVTEDRESTDNVLLLEGSSNHEHEDGVDGSLQRPIVPEEPDDKLKKNDPSDSGIASKQQFKDVVAIVDPPRAGLHPTVLKVLRTNPHLRRLVYISCNPESLVANAIELCTPSANKTEKGNKNNWGWRNMHSAGLARHRVKSMPNSEPFRPVKAMAVDLFPHTPHCEMVMLLER